MWNKFTIIVMLQPLNENTELSEFLSDRHIHCQQDANPPHLFIQQRQGNRTNIGIRNSTKPS
jgi:hypothetical protein